MAGRARPNSERAGPGHAGAGPSGELRLSDGVG